MTPSANARPAPFPAAFPSLWRVGRDSLWGESMSLLAQAGFTAAAQASALPDLPWPEGADPMGPRPSPAGGPEALRELALMSHPAGFILVLSSQERGPSEEPGSAPLHELELYFQIDVGAGRGDSRRQRLFSGGHSSRPDGSSLFLGRCDVANSHCGSLGEALEALCDHAAPLPLAQWSPEFFHTPPALFTPIPSEAVGRGARPRLAERFEARAQADWARFARALPSPLNRLVDYQGLCTPRATRDPHDLLFSTHDYARGQIQAAGLNWLAEDDAQTLRSWSEAIARAVHGKGPLELDSLDRRLPGGANALHLLAASGTETFLSKAPLDPLAAWAREQPRERLSRWLSERDACGLTPLALAFKTSLEIARRDPERLSMSPLARLFLELGLLGEPGEIGQTLHDALAPALERSDLNGRVRFSLCHALMIDAIDARARELSHCWAAPVDTPAGRLDNPAQSVEALLSKWGPQPPGSPAAALIEAFSLRASLSTDAKPPAAAPARL